MLAALLLAGVLAVFAMLPDIKDQNFSAKIMQNEHCEICYGFECYNIDENRCYYYRKTEKNLWDDLDNFEADDTEMRDRIDGHIMDYVHQDPWTETDCIPLVSQYTNCNRENVCTGCQMCNCDIKGRWNCTTMQRCKSTVIVSFNDITLAQVLKKLKNYLKKLQGIKRKRSVKYDDESEKEDTNYEDILKLLYGIQNLEHKHEKNPREKILTSQRVNNSFVYKKSLNNHFSAESNIWDTKYLRFEELLNSINYDKDRMLNLNEVAYDKNTLIYQNKSDFENLKSITTENSSYKEKNQVKQNDIIYVKSVEMPTFDYLNNFSNTRNLKKREIMLIPNVAQTNGTSELHYNSSANIIELKHNVLYPLFNIVNEKQKELEQLMNIKDKLVIYFKSFTDIDIPSNPTNISNKSNNSNLYFYQLEIHTESEDDRRKRRQNILENLIKKLKRDLFEVTRDIANIQKLSNSSAMPYDLKVLIQAIKSYGMDERYNEIKHSNIVNLIRRSDIDQNAIRLHAVTELHNIFDSLTIDKNIPLTKAMELVSKGGKQILKRIIEQLYNNNFANEHSKTFVPHNDIINLLKDIGSGCSKVLASVLRNVSHDQLYSMKLLHIEILEDIEKVKLALDLLQSAGNRRILLVNDSVGERLVSKKENDLKRIYHEIKQIMQLQVLNKYVKRSKSGKLPENKNSKRKSFLQTLKKLLRSSKKDIRDLFHKKASKSDIVKHIAKKNIDEMTKNKLLEYENTMQRWQNNLNVRNKRSAGEIGQFFNRLKNIIPNYLRGKVKPAGHKKNRNKTEIRSKHHHQGHKTNKRMKPKSTTSRMYFHR